MKATHSLWFLFPLCFSFCSLAHGHITCSYIWKERYIQKLSKPLVRISWKKRRPNTGTKKTVAISLWKINNIQFSESNKVSPLSPLPTPPSPLPPSLPPPATSPPPPAPLHPPNSTTPNAPTLPMLPPPCF